MKTWNYTKKLIVDNKTEDGRWAHEAAYNDQGAYQDWYYDQVDAGLADDSMVFLPHVIPDRDTMYTFLMTDQDQVDSYIAMAYAVAERIGHPLSHTVVDVDYTSDTIPIDFTIM
jgi:hypothetical protein